MLPYWAVEQGASGHAHVCALMIIPLYVVAVALLMFCARAADVAAAAAGSCENPRSSPTYKKPASSALATTGQ